MTDEDYVKIGEAAKILSRHRNSVLNYEKSGLLPPARREPVTDDRLWPRSVIEELAADLGVRGGVGAMTDAELMREALEALKEVPHAYKCSTYDEEADVPVNDGRCDCHLVAVNAFMPKLEERLLRE